MRLCHHSCLIRSPLSLATETAFINGFTESLDSFTITEHRTKFSLCCGARLKIAADTFLNRKYGML